MARTKRHTVERYADDVLSGKLSVSVWTRRAVERQQRDLKHGHKRGLVFKPRKAQHAIDFFSCLHHSKGEWAGRIIELEPWQQFELWVLFGWYRADGSRRFRTGYVEVPRKNGKALAIDTPVATPDGWKPHGDLRPGDRVFDPAGMPRAVLAVTPHYSGECYAVRFSDGSTIVAHARHEWRTNRSAHTGRKNGERRPLPEVETQQIAATLRHAGRGDLTHGIWTCAPLELPYAVLPVPPYTLGAWLGDGHSAGPRITGADPEILAAIAADGVPVRKGSAKYGYSLSDGHSGGKSSGLAAGLKRLGLLNKKHIPPMYLRASIEQRRQLLAGIVDTDGHVTPRGQCEVVLTRRELFDGVVELARSLGFKPTVTEDRATIYGRDISARFRLQFWPSLGELPLRVPRKLERLRRIARKRSRTRMIVGCEPIGDGVVNCITVEGGMYLAGDAMMPTHNSTKAAGVGLYLFCADHEPGAEVYSAATTRPQARIVHSEARRMVEASPMLKARIEIYRDNLSIAHTACKYEPVSSDYGTLDGLNPHGAMIDELHAHKDGGLVEKLRTALGARRQPLLYFITTAGVSGESVGYSEHKYARAVLEGMFDDDSYFAFISSIDEGDDPFAPASWKKANPNYGISVKPSMLKESAKRAERQAGLVNEFLRYHLNVWTSQSKRWMNLAAWDACPVLSGPNELVGEECTVGLDLANTTDLAAAAAVFPPSGERKVYTALMKFWVPAERVLDRVQKDRVPYDLWIRQGLITATPGNVIDYDVIRADLNAWGKLYSIQELGYDPWGATQIALQLQGDGFNCVPVRQGYRTLSEPTKFLEGIVLSHEFDHQGNAVLRWMASNVETMTDPAGNIKPAKDRSSEKIDGIVAVIAALSRIITTADSTSIYETQGIRVL